MIIPAALPAVLGREGAGIVEAIGDGVTRVKPDDSFVLSHGFCGACANCRRSRYSCCSPMPALNFGGIRLNTGRSPYAMVAAHRCPACFSRSRRSRAIRWRASARS